MPPYWNGRRWVNTTTTTPPAVAPPVTATNPVTTEPLGQGTADALPPVGSLPPPPAGGTVRTRGPGAQAPAYGFRRNNPGYTPAYTGTRTAPGPFSTAAPAGTAAGGPPAGAADRLNSLVPQGQTGRPSRTRNNGGSENEDQGGPRGERREKPARERKEKRMSAPKRRASERAEARKQGGPGNGSRRPSNNNGRGRARPTSSRSASGSGTRMPTRARNVGAAMPPMRGGMPAGPGNGLTSAGRVPGRGVGMMPTSVRPRPMGRPVGRARPGRVRAPIAAQGGPKGKLGSGARFKAIEKKAAKSGARNPAAVAASVGRKKYGATKMAKLSAAGRKQGGPSNRIVGTVAPRAGGRKNAMLRATQTRGAPKMSVKKSSPVKKPSFQLAPRRKSK